MFRLFKSRDKIGKQTQSAHVHNPIMRQQDESHIAALGAQQDAHDRSRLIYGLSQHSGEDAAIQFWRASSLRNAEEVKRLSKALAIHEARYARQMAGLKKATAAAAEKRRKV